MKFEPHIQAQFKKAGWVEGKSQKAFYDALPKFETLPSFLKEFLYEYGNLAIETFPITPGGVTGTLDMTVHKIWAEIDELIEDGSEYNLGNLYAIGQYAINSACYFCDDSGKVFQMGDIQVKISDNFKEGIEKIISEDYSDTKEWHPEVKEWKEERY